MPYDREAAIGYAADHWDTPCHDNRISLLQQPAINVPQKRREMGLGPDWIAKFLLDGSGGDEAAFVRGSEKQVFQGWDGLADCAHFMCRCLNAGGLKDLETDYVPYLNGYLRKLSFTKTLASEATQACVQRIINKQLMKEGDVILYVAPPGGELGGGYVHSAMFTTASTITCHSVRRFGEDWKAPHSDGYTFTLIHFSGDDALNPMLEARVNGWWEVTWRSETYYYFFANGHVSYTQQKPTSRIPLAFPKQRGYYFFDVLRNTVLICWTQTGTLEELTMTPDGSLMAGTWNGSEPLTGTKMDF